MTKARLHDEKAAFRRARGAVFEGVTEDNLYTNAYSAGA